MTNRLRVYPPLELITMIALYRFHKWLMFLFNHFHKRAKVLTNHFYKRVSNARWAYANFLPKMVEALRLHQDII